MKFWIGVAIGCFGAITGSTIESMKYQDVMCAGTNFVVEKADTIRTFSCTVELKSKESK